MDSPARQQPTLEQVESLLRACPFGLLVSHGASRLLSTPLPMLLEGGVETGALVGHLARSNPQARDLLTAPRALAVFMGPHGYISPSWLRDRTRAGTWNYAHVELTVEVTFLERDAFAQDADALARELEAGRADPWSPGEMGGRFARILPGVAPFRARITGLRARFKLSQDEPPEVFADSLAGLEREPNPELAALMRAARPPQDPV